MELKAAKDLLHSLKFQLDKNEKKECSKRPLQKQITDQFIKALFSQKIILKSRWESKLIAFFSPNSILDRRQRELLSDVALAIQTIWEDKSEHRLFQDDFYKDLRAEFKASKLLEKVAKESTCFATTEEFERLKQIKEQKDSLRREKLCQDSLFHSDYKSIFEQAGLPLSRLKQIFTRITNNRACEYFFQFLQKVPEYAIKTGFEERKIRLEQALKVDEALCNSMMQTMQPLPKDERLKALKAHSGTLATSVSQLKTGESTIVMGSYGVHIDKSEVFLRQMRQLPEVVSSRLPETVRKLIASDIELPDPANFIERTLRSSLGGVQSSLLTPKLLDILLYDKDKKLPEGISKYLPEKLVKELDALLQNGIAGCFVDFQADDSRQREILEWICLHGDIIRDPARLKVYMEDLQDQIAYYAGSSIGNPKGMLDKTIEDLMNRLQNLLPADLLAIMEMESHLTHGQIWLEIERQKNETFTVLVYGTGKALNLHARNGISKLEWPRKIEGVTLSQLHAGFFERFLYPHIETRYDSSYHATAGDIYKGVLESLSSSDQPIQTTKLVRELDPKIHRCDELAQVLLIDPQYALEHVTLEFHFQSLFDFCQVYFNRQEKRLRFQDEETVLAVDGMVKQLLTEWENCSDKLEVTRKRQVKATIDEIKEAISYWQSTHNRCQIDEDALLPEYIQGPLSAMAHLTGITSDYLDSVKDNLVWLWGQDFEPLINLLIQVLPKSGDQVDEKAMRSQKATTKQWEQKSMLIRFFAHVYFQVAFVALKCIFIVMNRFHSNASYIALGLGLDTVIRKFMPKQYLIWYTTVMSRLRNMILEKIISTFVSAEYLEQLKDHIQSHMEVIKKAADKLNVDAKIHFDVNLPAEAAKPWHSISVDKISDIVQEHSLKEAASPFLPKYFPALDTQITHGLLDSWLSILETSDQPEQKLIYFLMALDKLEVPSIKKGGIWDEIESPELCMEKLFQISMELPNLWHLTNGSLSYTHHASQYVILRFKLIAIMHKLAERTPSNPLPNQRIDISKLIIWQRENRKLDHPELQRQFNEIVAYCWPGVDVAKLLDKTAIAKLGYNCLFNYKRPRNVVKQQLNNAYSLGKGIGFLTAATIRSFIGKTLSNPRELTLHSGESMQMIALPHSQLNTPEFLFFKSVLDDPLVRTKLLERNIDLELDQRHLLKVLFHESFNIDSDLLPKPYLLFKTLTLQTELFKFDRTFFGSHTHFENTLQETWTNSLYNIAQNTCGDFKVPLQESITPLFFSNPAMDFMKEPIDPIFAKDMGKKMFDIAPRSQVQILRSAPVIPQELQNMDDYTELELILCKPEDRIMRALGYFRENKEKLKVLRKGQKYIITSPYLSFLEYVCYDLNSLSGALKSSPNFTVAIGEFLKEAFSHYQEKDKDPVTCMALVRLGHGLKSFLKANGVKDFSTFPVFDNELEKVKIECEQEEILKRYWYLHRLMILEETPKALSIEEQRKGVVELLKMHFQNFEDLKIAEAKNSQQNDDIQVSKYLLQELKYETQKRFYQWRDAIQEQLSDVSFRNMLINEILNEQCDSSLNLKWARTSDWTFISSEIRIDLLNRTIRDRRGNNLKQVQRSIKTSGSVCDALREAVEHLGLCENGKWRTADQRYQVDNENLEITQTIDQKTYSYVKNGHKFLSVFFTEAEVDIPAHATFWMEKSSDEEKLVRLQYDVEGVEKFIHVKIRKNPENSDEYQFSSLLEEGNELLPIRLHQINHFLSTFKRFCSLDQIRGWVCKAENRIKSLKFLPFDLTFKIQKNEAGTWQAMSEGRYAGFAMAEKQWHSKLRAFNSYLLLEPKSGLKKVLLPDGQWLSSFAWRGVGKLGILGNLAVDALHEWDQKFIGELEKAGIVVEKDKYYAFDFDEKTGELTSEEPEAMAYLILLYLSQGRSEAALQASEQLEKLAKRMPFSNQVSLKLSPLGLVQFDEIRAIRIKLFSVLEENRILHKNENISEKRPLDLLQSISVLMDLDYLTRRSNSALKITPSQEWFLYQHVFTMFKELLNQTVKRSSYKKMSDLWEFIEMAGIDSAIEAVCLPAHLATRYRALKNKFDLGDNLGLILVNQGKQILSTPSAIPSNLSSQTAQYLSQGLYEATGESQSHYLLQMMKLVASTAFFSRKSLEPEKLRNEIDSKLEMSPPLNVEQITPTIFKKYFISYYRLARSEDKSDQKFSQTLQLLSGGWDEETQLLVYYLQAVRSFPLGFPSTEEFINHFLDNSREKTISPDERWKDFLKDIHNRTLVWHAWKQGCHTAKNSCLNYLFSNAFYSFVPVIEQFVGTGLNDYTLNFASKALNAITGALSKNESVAVTFEEVAPSLEVLSKEDQLVDNELIVVFSLVFSVEKPPQSAFEKLVTPYDISEIKDLSLKARFKRVNESIIAYYKREGRVPDLLRYKGSEGLWEAYVWLEKYRESFKLRLEHDKAKLLEHINSQIKNGTRVTLEQLQFNVLKNEYQGLIDSCQYQPEEARLVASILMHVMHREIRLQQIDRSLVLLQKLNDPMNVAKFNPLLEELAEQLKARRAYIDPEKPISTRLLMRYLMFELKNQKIIWKRQHVKIGEMLLEANQNAVFEFIMGLGKTSAIIPIVSAMEADGTKAVFNIYPSPIAGTNIKSLSDQFKKLYGATVNGFMFSRSFPKSKEEVNALAVVLQSSSPASVSAMTKEDAQSIMLKLFDELYHCAHIGIKERIQRRDSIESSRHVLRIMRSGKAIADEAHDVYNRIQELNYPIGNQATIKDSYYRVVERCMRLVSEDIRLQILISQNNLPRLNLKTFFKDIALKVASQMLGYAPLDMGSRTVKEQAEFVAYVTNNLNYIPQWIEENPLFSEIAMVKGCLTILFPNVFQNLVSVNFDAPTNKKKYGQYAHPADGNNRVQNTSCFKSPYETLVKTFIQFFCKGLNAEQCLTLIQELQKKAENFAKKQKILYKNLAGVVKSCNIFKTKEFTEEQLNEIVATFGKNADAIQLYIRYFVKKQIPYWIYNLCSNSLSFASLFGSIVSNTGTPFNDGTYPHRCNMVWDEGTAAEALHTLHKKCSENGIHILEEDNPRALLDEILQRFFNKDSNFTAIIDGGALFKGVSNEEIAKKMLAHAQIYLPHIKAVKFFRKDQYDRDELVWLEIGATEATSVDERRIPAEYCLTYFDHPHCFAADVPQKKYESIGLELIGEQEKDQTLQRYFQDCFRMRELNKDECVVSDEPSSGYQSIEFAMTKAAQRKISGSKKPTLDDIVKFGIANEAARAKEDNYAAQLQKIAEVIRCAIKDAIIFAPTFEDAVMIWLEFETVLVDVLEDDPKKLYGMIEKKVPYQEALQTAADKALQTIVNSKSITDPKKEEIKSQLIELANPPPETMPEQVIIFTNGKEIHLDVLKDLNKETRMEVNCETENENENENENLEEVQNEQNLHQNMHFTNFLNHHWEQEWPKDLEFLKKGWMRFTELQSYLKETLLKTIDRWAYIITTPNALPFPLFQWHDLIRNEVKTPLKMVGDAFDKRLWCSNQFIPKQVLPMQSEVHVGAKEQGHLFEILVHYNEKEDGSLEIEQVGTLTINEAATWRQYLETMSDGQKQSNKKVILYDMQSRVDVVGSDITLEKLRQDKDFQKLEVMLLFINGHTHYQEYQVSILKNWIEANNSSQMKDAFMYIFNHRGKGIYEGSIISTVFDELLNVPWIDSL